MPEVLPTERLRWRPTTAELAHALRRQRGLACGLGALVGLAAAAAVWLVTPAGRHEAQTLLHLKPDTTRPDPDFEGFKQTQVRLLLSPAVFERVAADPTVARRLDGRPARQLEDATRVRWESPELLAVTMMGDDPELLRAALDVLVAEYLRNAATEDGIARLKQRRAIEERLAEPDSPSPTGEDSRAALQQELLRLDLADRAGPRVIKRDGTAVVLNRNLCRKTVRSAAAFAGGLLVALAAVALAEWRRRRVDTAEQLTDVIGVPILGTTPALRAENWQTASPVASARLTILQASRDRSLQVVAVSGATRNEGAAVLAARLAADLAALGQRTLLLDGDTRAPSLHGLFDSPLTPGCGELLLQEVDLAEAARPTAEPNLWLVPAGEHSDRVTAALAQGHPVAALFDRLRRQYDFVVMNAGPVLVPADASFMSRYADGVVLAVLRDVSRLPSVQTAIRTLEQLDIPLLGAVVHGVESSAGTS